LKIKDKSNLD